MNGLQKPLVTSLAFAGAALAICFCGATPGAALDDKVQLLSGGGLIAPFSTVYTSPGLSTSWDINTPATGQGEKAAQLRMSAGVLKNLKVKVTTQHVPAGGNVTITVRLNGVNTTLTCSVTGTGWCAGGAAVVVTDSSLLAVKATNSLEDGGNVAFTYTLIYD